MPKGKSTFKQGDLTRAMKAARTAGLTIVRTEIQTDGKLILVHSDEGQPKANALDDWLERNAR